MRTRSVQIALSENARLLQKSNPDFSPVPYQGTDLANFYDLYACILEPVFIYPQKEAFIPLGIHFNFANSPNPLFSIMAPSSGCQGYVFANTIGIIDTDYTGETIARVRNISEEGLIFDPMQKIGHMGFFSSTFVTFEIIDKADLLPTVRGKKGFGTGSVQPITSFHEFKRRNPGYPKHLRMENAIHFLEKDVGLSITVINEILPSILFYLNGLDLVYKFFPERLYLNKYDREGNILESRFLGENWKEEIKKLIL